MSTPTPYGPVDPNASFPQAPVQPPKKSHKLRNGIIGGAALLALMGGCMNAISGGGTENAAQADPVVATSTAPVEQPSASAPAKPATKAAAPAAKPKPAPKPAPAPKPKPAPKPEPKLSVSQEEAIESAESYIDSGDFSKKSLIAQLKYEKFSTKEAKYAVEHIDVDWQQEADDSAASYMDSGSFSRGTLRDQLLYEGFSKKQAKHAVDSVF